jgi:hypothetical protein
MLIEEEQEVYTTFKRPVATGINFFSFFAAEIDEEEPLATIKYTDSLCDKTVPREKAHALADYVKHTLRELRKGKLTESTLIQRRMYWFLSKLMEYNVFPTGFARLMSFYQASIVELDE